MALGRGHSACCLRHDSVMSGVRPGEVALALCVRIWSGTCTQLRGMSLILWCPTTQACEVDEALRMLLAQILAAALALARQLPKPGAPAQVEVGEPSGAPLLQRLPGLSPCTTGRKAQNTTLMLP